MILFGEVDNELDVEVAVRHWVLVERHTKVFDSFKLLIVKNFTWSSGDSVLFAIKMRKIQSNSSEGFKQRNFLNVNKVSSSSFIDRVLFYLDPDVDVSCDGSGLLVVFACKDVVMLVWTS